MEPAFLLAVMVITSADNKLIRIRNGSVRIRISLLIVGYIRQGAHGFIPVHHLMR